MNHDDTDWTVVMLPDIVVGGILARVAFFQFLKLGQDKVVITVQTTHCGWRILKYVYLLSLIILLHLAGILILPPPATTNCSSQPDGRADICINSI